MSPTFSHGARGQVYRYYVSAGLQQGQRYVSDSVRRISATILESHLSVVLARLLPITDGDALGGILRVEVYPTSIQLLLPAKYVAVVTPRLAPDESVRRDAENRMRLRLTLPFVARRQGGRARIVAASSPTNSRRDLVLIKALRAAHTLVARNKDAHPIIETAPETAHARRLVRLAFLAPDLQAAILQGRQSEGLTVERLTRDAPALLWWAQRSAFG